MVILTDMLKAVIARLVGIMIFEHFGYSAEEITVFAKYWAAVFCLVCYMFPWMFEFKGGKGILSG